ncbi:MAG: transposase [Patescibacteria group bacterium]
MTLRRTIAPGEYYHVYNRGAFKTATFRDKHDLARFLFEVIYFQSPTPFPKVGRLAATYSEAGFDVSERDFLNVLNGRSVELVSFCIMGNHYHLLLRELVEGGIARYMQRLGDAYTKYFNAKYQSPGHVFQGRYKAVHVATNEQLMYLSAYIHRNPRELKAWKDKEDRYPWSSLTDYVKENRWGGLLAQEIILDQFEGTKRSNYADFVRTSGAKEFEEKELL